MTRFLDLPCWAGTYRFHFTDDMSDHGGLHTEGLYIFLRPTGPAQWALEYIGKATNLHQRLSSHDRWPEAKRRGATHAGVYLEGFPGLASVDVVEAALIATHNPPMNEHHRTGAAGLVNALTDFASIGLPPPAPRRAGLVDAVLNWDTLPAPSPTPPRRGLAAVGFYSGLLSPPPTPPRGLAAANLLGTGLLSDGPPYFGLMPPRK